MHLQLACEPMVLPSCSAQDRIDAKALSEVWKREATDGHLAPRMAPLMEPLMATGGGSDGH
jgi:hypothetical protein